MNNLNLPSMYIGFNNGAFTDTSLISISVDNMGVNRGYAAFDFFGVHHSKPFYLERHLDRFMKTISLLRLEISYSRTEIRNYIEAVLQKNQERDFYIKLFALPLFSDTARNLKSGIYIVPLDVDPYPAELYTEGGILITKEYKRFLPEAKSTNYLPLVFWYPEISESKAVDVLYCSNNTIQESSRGNIFLVKDKVVFTPATGILKGITRSVVIDIMKDESIKLVEKTISLEELFQADEMFLSSTTKKILPIVTIDGNIIGSGKVGEVTQILIKDFEVLQNSY